MKLYELLSNCNNTENSIVVKKDKEILFKIETKTGEGIKFSGIDTLKQLEYARMLEIAFVYVDQIDSSLCVFIK
jgi:hypothetical protein